MNYFFNSNTRKRKPSKKKANPTKHSKTAKNTKTKTNTKTNKKRTPVRKNGSLYFEDQPEFRPNLSPREIFKLGSFGGTYWRPIYSGVNRKQYKNVHKKYPKSWWSDIPEDRLSSPDYDKEKNKYKVKVGTTLEFWESKKWIKSFHPYGWVHWYCDFYLGKRCSDDERQISRWKALAGPNGRFMKFLVTQIQKKRGNYNDVTISPKIRQVLQHWGYKLTKGDYNREMKYRRGTRKNRK